MADYSAALAAMEAAVREHCPELTAFSVRLQFDDEDGGNTFTKEYPPGPLVIHNARTGVISSAIGEVVARVVHRTAGVAVRVETALDKFNKNADLLKDETPLERLRYFLSHALNGQDWLDVEPFLDALAAGVAVPASVQPLRLLTREECDAVMELPSFDTYADYENLQRRFCEVNRLTLGVMVVDEALALARRFHEAYERLAPHFGYETRAETREFDPSSPNGRLMVAVCRDLFPAGVAGTPAPDTEALQWAVKTLRFLMPGTPVGPHAEFEKAVAALGVAGTQGDKA